MKFTTRYCFQAPQILEPSGSGPLNLCPDVSIRTWEGSPWCGPLWPTARSAFCGDGFFGFRFLGEGGYFEGLGEVVHSSAGESE